MTRRAERATLIVSLLLLVAALEWWAWNSPPGGNALNGTLHAVHEKGIDLLVDLASLFITFAYAVIGALAYVLKEHSERSHRRSRYDTFLLCTTVLTALLSIFFGHIILTTVVEMLSNDFLDLRAERIVLSVRAQYLFLLLSVLALLTLLYEQFSPPPPVTPPSIDFDETG